MSVGVTTTSYAEIALAEIIGVMLRTLGERDPAYAEAMRSNLMALGQPYITAEYGAERANAGLTIMKELRRHAPAVVPDLSGE